METRPYFVFGDLLANASVGALVGVVCAACFGSGWNMVLAMFLCMALGMALSLPFALGFGALFGAMEVMLPVMTTGMLAGMVASMAGAMEGLALARGATLGLWSGLAVVVVTYVANALIRGRASRWTA